MLSAIDKLSKHTDQPVHSTLSMVYVRIRKSLFLVAVIIPPVAFYVLLGKSLLTVPLQDDYHAILGFLLQWKKESGLRHLAEILFYQHNDYRFMFENAIVGLQYMILGHTNLKALSVLGDLFVIPIFGVLYLIWRDCGLPREYTLCMFIPVSWLLFQLQYESTLNLPTPSLQFLPVMFFALLTCWLAPKPGLLAFQCTLLSFLLCVASCSNGLFLIPILALIYIQFRAFKRLAVFCALSAFTSIVYFHGYNFASEMQNTHASNSVVSIFQHFSPRFAAAFLGSIASIRDPIPAIVFGIALTALFAFATFDRLFIRRPAIFYSCLFILITGLAVSGLRSNFGIVAALGSRYRINSTILLILLFLYMADRFYGVSIRPLILKTGACTAALLLIAFTYESDRTGEKLLLAKRHAVELEMLRWESHDTRHIIEPAFRGDFTAENERNGLFDPIEPYLSDSLREGIYQLPELPTKD